LTRREYAGWAATDDRFYELLAELRRDREEGARKWDEQNRKWDQHQAEQREEFKRIHEQIMAQAQRLIVISPMIDARARQVAERLGIETYGDSLEVQAL
jgi:hypothetical protein